MPFRSLTLQAWSTTTSLGADVVVLRKHGSRRQGCAPRFLAVEPAEVAALVAAGWVVVPPPYSHKALAAYEAQRQRRRQRHALNRRRNELQAQLAVLNAEASALAQGRQVT
jgi:hypothetical protein